jgi:LDH2 family malate/lactate/ureidoglycolate dehydrogenase
MTNEVRGEPSKQGERVQLANDPQIEETQRRQKEGIPIDDSLWREFQNLSSVLNVTMIQ